MTEPKGFFASMIIIPTRSAKFLTSKLKTVNPIWSVFPDGEINTKLVLPKTDRVVVLHSGSPNPNEGLVELEMILSILNQSSVKKIEVFFTYFPYAQVDSIADAIIRKLVNYYKVSKIYAIDPHFSNKTWINKYPIKIISAVELLIKAASKKFPDMVFVAADQGAIVRAGFPGPTKTRLAFNKVRITFDSSLTKRVKGKTIGVVDDLIETGSTLVSFYKACKKAGAKDIVALVSHGVLVEGIHKARQIFKELYLTNSIKTAKGDIDISSLITQAIKN